MWYLTLIIILLVIMIGLIWVKSAKRREYTVSVAKSYCQKHNLQFLDDSVVLKSWHMSKSLSGKRIMVRIYQFVCSSEGVERLYGVIVFNGNLLKDVYLEKTEVNSTEHLFFKDNNNLSERCKNSDNVIAFKARSEQKKDKL
ncbi:DUF3301 domain-containing protein [Thiotrichales bacterium 19S3-7]|nr:DUF3301 domain-containing protein [Thiotrichales bacterium 19S3-7]MCF6802491.1 DUF3301 domain-containing protein [Thiotrichales bacterium 19S3-11]